ncbi:hypothetical protein O2W14_11320 [Modestobacter sp. VKM Ac-2986]|uniref:hypothetical protein n=1 Tax=Modestobacter sp. VKM Ac-2986 TaxID=3004140 RepID=UPI0022ABB5D7|nr:hypothetical protein [Modestobacter sp. VKM Ac-2986]MCZ2829424.1 hypothetical protein [Modestobacter sp. VKM Ac-2986]
MSRTLPRRIAVTAGLTLVAGGGLGLLPSAARAADLPVPVVIPSTVAPGQAYSIDLAGCFDTRSDVLPGVGADAGEQGHFIGLGNGSEAYPDGTGSLPQRVQRAAPLGTYTINAICTGYNGVQDYPPVTLTVTADGKPLPAAAVATAAPAFTPGAVANTPGIGSTTSASTTVAAAPGQEVLRVLRGFQPHEVVTVVLHSTPVVLGEFTADTAGVVTVRFTVPAGSALGTHTLAYDGDRGSHFEETITLTADGTALAYTGADVTQPLAGGAALVALGAGALLLGRRRRRTPGPLKA